MTPLQIWQILSDMELRTCALIPAARGPSRAVRRLGSARHCPCERDRALVHVPFAPDVLVSSTKALHSPQAHGQSSHQSPWRSTTQRNRYCWQRVTLHCSADFRQPPIATAAPRLPAEHATLPAHPIIVLL